MEQRYTSRLLTHFVGGKEKTPEEQFKILLKILQDKQLLSPAAQLNPRLTGWKSWRVPNRITEKNDMNTLFTIDVVCFADIPVTDLSIHISKYSQFGISFSKEFLVSEGASPVFYVCANAIDSVANAQLEHVFRHAMEAFVEWYSNTKDKVPLQMFLTTYVFPMMKFWSDSPEDKAVENYYMEREWRVPTRVEFSLADVRRLILPKRFIQPLKNAFPKYEGDILSFPISL